MIIWGIFWGAMLGWWFRSPTHSDLGLFVGGFLGFFAGLSLRWMVRSAIRGELQAHARKAVVSALEVAGSAAVPPGEPVPASPALVEGQVMAEQLVTQAPASSSVATSPEPTAEVAWAGELTSQGPPRTAESAVRTPSAPTVPVQPRPPAQPAPVELALLAVQNWFLGGNTIVRVGLVILFIGLSFLARYAVSFGLFPVEFRLAVIAVAAIALLVVGFRKRTEKPAFALALQGGGVAVMYLTVFAAFRLYGLLPPLLAFGMMIGVCAMSCALALLQNSRALAVAAFAGGFAVPVLLSTGQGSHVTLFSYYTLLNLAILFIAYKRSWRVLNVVGFIATFGVAAVWGALKYAPEQYASTQPFLAGFVLIYLFAAILYARNTPTKLGNAVDTMLVFGTPLAGFGLQAGLVQQFELGSAFSALAFAALYLVAAMVLARRALDSYRLLIECFIAVGVGFATLAVPLALDARWTSAVWALEGAGAFWVGMRQGRWMPRAFGLLLQGVAALAFMGSMGINVSFIALANPAFFGALLIALSALLLAWWLRKPLAHSGSVWAKGYAGVEAQLASPVYLYGFAFWCMAWLWEITRRVPGLEAGQWPAAVFSERLTELLVMLAVVVSAALSMALGLKARWAVATWPARGAIVVMMLGFLAQSFNGYRVLATPAWAVWTVVLVLHFWMLRQTDRLHEAAGDSSKPSPGGWFHAASAWLVTFLVADCLWSGIARAELWRTSWAGVVMLVSAIAVLMLLALWAGRGNRQAARAALAWPLNPHAEAYYWLAAVPLAVLVFWGTLVVAIFSPGRTEPLPYIALLNPTDLTLALALGALVFWRRVLLSAVPPPAMAGWFTGQKSKGALVALALLAFVVVNTVWLRIAHHFFGVRWDAEALFGSFVVQTGYAILWTLLALSMMVLAHRRVQRLLWLVGAGLLGLVVVKLLLIDLSNAGGAERIIAFIVVGVLMLVVGYVAPLPPKAPAAVGSESEPDNIAKLREIQS